MLYDLVVVGAGPAGASAALGAVHARPGVRVLLVDRAEFPRDKACGDAVAPQALDELAEMGATTIVEGCTPVRRLRIEGPDGEVVDRELARPDYVVPRRLLDARIRAAALAAGAEPARGVVRGVTAHTGEVMLHGRGAVDGVRARVVVGADGASSAVRRALGLARNPPQALAVAVRGYAPSASATQLVRMDRTDWPAYAWSFPIGDGTANVGYGLLTSRLGGDGKALLHGRLTDLLPGEPADPATLRAAHLPLSSARPRPGHGRVLLAGDAASLVNPLTGEGIYYAVASGRRAGEAAVLTPARPATAYVWALRRLLGSHLRQMAALGPLTRRPWPVAAALRAAARDRRVFDELVTTGLANGVLRSRSLARVAAAALQR